MSFVEYIGYLNGGHDEISFNPLSLAYNREGISTIEIINDPNLNLGIRLKFGLSKEFSEEEALLVTKTPLENVVNLFLYEYGYVLDRIQLHRFNNHVYLYSNITMKSSATIGDDFLNLKDRIKDIELLNSLANNDYFRLYKSAVQITDSVGKFMFLYSILFYKKGTQGGVEVLIKEISSEHGYPYEEPERIAIRNNVETPVKETVYTWIRNHLGHTNHTTNMSEVRGYIDKYLPSLANIVLKAIV